MNIFENYIYIIKYYIKLIFNLYIILIILIIKLYWNLFIFFIINIYKNIILDIYINLNINQY